MRIIALILILFSGALQADCNLLPKPDLKVSETAFKVIEGPQYTYTVVAGWRTTSDTAVCCKHTKYGGGYWLAAVSSKAGEQIQTGDAFFTTLLADPAVDGPVTPEIQTVCNQLAALLLPPIGPPPTVAPATSGQRPMYRLRDESLPYSKDTNPRVTLKVNGNAQYVAVGTNCERAPVIETTTAGQWLYTTNADRVRGIALCRQ